MWIATIRPEKYDSIEFWFNVGDSRSMLRENSIFLIENIFNFNLFQRRDLKSFLP